MRFKLTSALIDSYGSLLVSITSIFIISKYMDYNWKYYLLCVILLLWCMRPIINFYIKIKEEKKRWKLKDKPL